MTCFIRLFPHLFTETHHQKREAKSSHCWSPWTLWPQMNGVDSDWIVLGSSWTIRMHQTLEGQLQPHYLEFHHKSHSACVFHLKLRVKHYPMGKLDKKESCEEWKSNHLVDRRGQMISITKTESTCTIVVRVQIISVLWYSAFRILSFSPDDREVLVQVGDEQVHQCGQGPRQQCTYKCSITSFVSWVSLTPLHVLVVLFDTIKSIFGNHPLISEWSRKRG